jgi:hypothetical protein
MGQVVVGQFVHDLGARAQNWVASLSLILPALAIIVLQLQQSKKRT